MPCFHGIGSAGYTKSYHKMMVPHFSENNGGIVDVEFVICLPICVDSKYSAKSNASSGSSMNSWLKSSRILVGVAKASEGNILTFKPNSESCLSLVAKPNCSTFGHTLTYVKIASLNFSMWKLCRK